MMFDAKYKRILPVLMTTQSSLDELQPLIVQTEAQTHFIVSHMPLGPRAIEKQTVKLRILSEVKSSPQKRHPDVVVVVVTNVQLLGIHTPSKRSKS